MALPGLALQEEHPISIARGDLVSQRPMRGRECSSCWYAVTTVYPLGNCHSLTLETSIELLDSDWDGFLSPLTAQFLFRENWQCANIARGTGE